MHPERFDPPASIRSGAAAPPELLVWAARLEAGSALWRDQARRLVGLVRTPALSGGCARALVEAGEVIAAEVGALARDIERCGQSVRAGTGG